MGRRILGIIAGLVSAMILISSMEMLAIGIYPPPPGTNLEDPQQMKDFIAQAPLLAMLIVLLGYNLAAFVGGWVATRVGKGPTMHLIVGGVVMFGTFVNLFQLPHPLWFAIAAIVSLLLTISAGSLLSRKTS